MRHLSQQRITTSNQQEWMAKLIDTIQENPASSPSFELKGGVLS